jgi:hypothetical protein
MRAAVTPPHAEETLKISLTEPRSAQSQICNPLEYPRTRIRLHAISALAPSYEWKSALLRCAASDFQHIPSGEENFLALLSANRCPRCGVAYPFRALTIVRARLRRCIVLRMSSGRLSCRARKAGASPARCRICRTHSWRGVPVRCAAGRASLVAVGLLARARSGRRRGCWIRRSKE